MSSLACMSNSLLLCCCQVWSLCAPSSMLWWPCCRGLMLLSSAFPHLYN